MDIPYFYDGNTGKRENCIIRSERTVWLRKFENEKTSKNVKIRWQSFKIKILVNQKLATMQIFLHGQIYTVKDDDDIFVFFW